MSTLKQMLTQLAEGVASDTDWLLENQYQQEQEQDAKLADAEALVRYVLEVIVSQRQRLNFRRRPQERPQEQLAQDQPVRESQTSQALEKIVDKLEKQIVPRDTQQRLAALRRANQTGGNG